MLEKNQQRVLGIRANEHPDILDSFAGVLADSWYSLNYRRLHSWSGPLPFTDRVSGYFDCRSSFIPGKALVWGRAFFGDVEADNYFLLRALGRICRGH